MILIVALVIFYFKNKAKKISFYSLILFVIMTLSINTLLGVVRNSLRSGGGTENVSVGSKEFLYTLESNFDIYKPFYSLVTKYPSQYDFTMGESIIQDSFTMWIPRSLWENKPLAEDYTMPIGLRRSVSDFAVLHAGLAWPNIAEFYMEFGSLGCVLIFYFFGRICKSINMLYYSENAHFLVAYSVAYTLLLQFIIRGAVSLFIPFLVFTLLPFVVIFFVTKENKS
jgi:oligosaccharide repeat unit polymerase